MNYDYVYKISLVDNFYKKHFKNKLDYKIKYLLSKIKLLLSTYFIFAPFKRTKYTEFPHKIPI